MKPDFLCGWMRLARAMDKGEDIAFSSMDKEILLIVNILLYDIISMLYSCVLIWAPTLQTLADNMRSFLWILYCSHWHEAND